MYSILFVSRDDRLRNLATKFIPAVTEDMKVHVADGSEAAVVALGVNRSIDAVVFDFLERDDVRGFMNMLCRSRLDVPVILVSGRPDEGVLEDAINLRVEGYVRYGGKDITDFFKELGSKASILIERHRNVMDHRIDEQRMAAMIEMAKMDHTNFQAVVDYALEKSIELTGSDIGYVSLFDESTGGMRMLAWSRKAMRMCEADYTTRTTNLRQTGLWGEPLRTGETVIVNDYESDERAMKKGTPIGHVKLRRLLMIPIFVDGRLIGTAGVGNKLSEYTRIDERQLKLMMMDLFEIHLKMENARKEAADLGLVDSFIRSGPLGFVIADADLNTLVVNPTARRLLGVDVDAERFCLNDVGSDQVVTILRIISKVRATGTAKSERLNITDGVKDITCEVYVQPSEPEAALVGYMIILTDITELIEVVKESRRAAEHIAVLEGPVLNRLIQVCNPMVGGDGSLHFLDSTVRFMNDYRMVGQNGPAWMNLDEVIERAAKAATLGNTELSVNTLGLKIFADESMPLVFKHLMNNSVVHGGASQILIRCRVTNGNLSIIYSDDGCGVSKDILKELDGLASEGRFGLFLVRSILQTSGFVLRSLDLDSGSSFSIGIPPGSFIIE